MRTFLKPLTARLSLLDEYMRLELVRIRSMQANIISQIEYIGDYMWHPSMCHFRNRTLLSARGPEPLTFEIPHFHWVDMINSSISVSGPLAINTKNYRFIGKEQVRLININDNVIHMSFTVPRSMTYARMQTANLQYNTTSGSFDLTKPVYMHRTGDDKRVVQKNWAPFLYNGTIYFVYNVFPLLVIKLENSLDPGQYFPNEDDYTMLATVSEEKCLPGMEQPWEYGHMRGGSSIKLVNGEYMAFFHSKSAPLENNNGWSLPSYWMGVYTFSATFPFRMTKISKFPIFAEDWVRLL